MLKKIVLVALFVASAAVGYHGNGVRPLGPEGARARGSARALCPLARLPG